MLIRKRTEGSMAVYALLSIWICVIISISIRPERTREAISGSGDPLVLILDPGHGGLDGGAVSVTGTPESRINWEIAERSAALAEFCGLRTIMTRSTYEIDYPAELRSISACKKWDTHRRTDLANDTPGGLLLSIHQNFYPAAAPHGAQVLYSRDLTSRELAEALQRSFCAALPADGKRKAVPAGRDIYLMNHVHCPAILVECGFLSHPEEAARLESAGYQKKLSMIMIREICRIRE